jgi:hypothetical protein
MRLGCLSDSPRMAAVHAQVWRAGMGSSAVAVACSRLWNRRSLNNSAAPFSPAVTFSGGIGL